MEIRNLRYFLAVAREENMTRTGVSTDIPQSGGCIGRQRTGIQAAFTEAGGETVSDMEPVSGVYTHCGAFSHTDQRKLYTGTLTN